MKLLKNMTEPELKDYFSRLARIIEDFLPPDNRNYRTQTMTSMSKPKRKPRYKCKTCRDTGRVACYLGSLRCGNCSTAPLDVAFRKAVKRVKDA